MKKNFLAPVLENKAVSSVTRFCTAHKSTLLAGGTIGFSITTTAVVFRNSPMIHQIIWDTRDAVEAANSEEEKKLIYKAAIKDLTPLIAPIIFFQTGTIVTTIMSKKDSDKKDKRIAELTSAVAVASQAIEQYQLFQKEAETQLGEKKYDKLQKDISKDTVVDGRRFTAIASEGAPGEVLMIDAYTGKPFWSTVEKCQYAAHELSNMLRSGSELVTVADFHEGINNPDLISDTETLTSKFGYVEGGYGTDDISAKFADTHYRFPNGTTIPAFRVYLYPEPACIEFD